MEAFYSYVAIGLVLVLIAVLVLIGVTMSKTQMVNTFPPVQHACPDYWEVGVGSKAGYCKFPANGGKNRGTIAAENGDSISASNGAWAKTLVMADDKKWMKFNDSSAWSTLYPGLTDICAKKRWAENNGIVFDTVTNTNSC
jgi:hypothetical protein